MEVKMEMQRVTQREIVEREPEGEGKRARATSSPWRVPLLYLSFWFAFDFKQLIVLYLFQIIETELIFVSSNNTIQVQEYSTFGWKWLNFFYIQYTSSNLYGYFKFFLVKAGPNYFSSSSRSDLIAVTETFHT